MNAVTGALPRRHALQAVAAAGLAVPLAQSGRARPQRAGTADSAQRAGEPGAGTAASAGPVIAHVRDARTGEIDIFCGVTRVRVHDAALAALITRAGAR